jgi:hypothetical protein
LLPDKTGTFVQDSFFVLQLKTTNSEAVLKMRAAFLSYNRTTLANKFLLLSGLGAGGGAFIFLGSSVLCPLPERHYSTRSGLWVAVAFFFPRAFARGYSYSTLRIA